LQTGIYISTAEQASIYQQGRQSASKRRVTGVPRVGPERVGPGLPPEAAHLVAAAAGPGSGARKALASMQTIKPRDSRRGGEGVGRGPGSGTRKRRLNRLQREPARRAIPDRHSASNDAELRLGPQVRTDRKFSETGLA
jgi:hypothetical protein